MKKLLIITALFMLLFISKSFSNITIQSSTIQYWAYWSSPDDRCYPFGTECLVIIQLPILTASADKLPNSTYSIDISFGGNINQGHTRTGHQPINFSIPSSNYQFGAGEFITIDECSDYPELNGRQLNLTGSTIDSQGNLNLIIQ